MSWHNNIINIPRVQYYIEHHRNIINSVGMHDLHWEFSSFFSKNTENYFLTVDYYIGGLKITLQWQSEL